MNIIIEYMNEINYNKTKISNMTLISNAYNSIIGVIFSRTTAEIRQYRDVAPCNLNIPPIVKKLELCHQQNNKRSSFIEIPMLDSSRKARDTKLIAGNILVFGRSPQFNQRISQILKKAFRENYYDALIIDVDQFLAMPDEARQNSDVLYIIVCSDLHINPKKLTILKNQVSNTIICKLPGLERLIQVLIKPILHFLPILH